MEEREKKLDEAIQKLNSLYSYLMGDSEIYIDKGAIYEINNHLKISNGRLTKVEECCEERKLFEAKNNERWKLACKAIVLIVGTGGVGGAGYGLSLLF